MPASTRSQQPKPLDEVRQVLRLHHYSIHTERSYVKWSARFVRFHDMGSREDLYLILRLPVRFAQALRLRLEGRLSAHSGQALTSPYQGAESCVSLCYCYYA